MPVLYLYTTLGCHLCEQAHAMIGPVVASKGIEIESVDIANSDTLMERYGIRIPVVRLSDRSDDLGWPFDEPAFLAYLQGPTD